LLDVHILDYKSVKDYYDKCIATVEEAAKNCNFAVAIHIVKGEPHLGKSRNRGFSCGSFPFATYVDNDDYVLPSAFSILENYIGDGIDALFTREYTLLDGELRQSNNRHHLAVYSRDSLIDHSKYIVNCDTYQRASVVGKNVIDIQQPVYVWRLWESPGSELRLKHLNTDHIFEKK
jgi:hypothetical protein